MDIKHERDLRRLLADGFSTCALRDFPPALLVTPNRLVSLAFEIQPENAKGAQYQYREWTIIRDLVFTLMEEWGWTAEERSK